jgi:hypothetical protein
MDRKTLRSSHLSAFAPHHDLQEVLLSAGRAQMRRNVFHHCPTFRQRDHLEIPGSGQWAVNSIPVVREASIGVVSAIRFHFECASGMSTAAGKRPVGELLEGLVQDRLHANRRLGQIRVDSPHTHNCRLVFMLTAPALRDQCRHRPWNCKLSQAQ